MSRTRRKGGRTRPEKTVGPWEGMRPKTARCSDLGCCCLCEGSYEEGSEEGECVI